ncbi:MAG TPA: hypothetical protein VMQ52_02795 [Candidatus Saccharimonadales bacterium]|jgi:hypothetical protein|nr:hypothetical protein [Candidatus Saccharimonadales bacterium]
MAQLLAYEQIHSYGGMLDVDLEEDTDKIKIEVMPGADGLFNVAAWENVEEQDLEGIIRYERTVCLLGRGPVILAGIGLPDVAPLVYRELDSGGRVKLSETVYEPEEGKDFLEDPRVLLQGGKLIIGLTSVIKKGEEYIPHPAIVITSKAELATGLREHKIVTNLGRGDQTTPIGDNIDGKNTTIIDETTFMFRPEGTENNHRLRVFRLNDGELIIQQNDIKLPDNIPWATFKAGTTMPPVWLNDREAIFPIHGIRKDQNGIFVYSIGSARLVRSVDGILSVDNISQKPLIYPELFDGLVDTEKVELHPEFRHAVYCVSGSPVYDSCGNFQELKMIVSRGDTLTFEVTVPKNKLVEGWHTDQDVHPLQPLSEAA